MPPCSALGKSPISRQVSHNEGEEQDVCLSKSHNSCIVLYLSSGVPLTHSHQAFHNTEISILLPHLPKNQSNRPTLSPKHKAVLWADTRRQGDCLEKLQRDTAMVYT